MLVLSVGRMTAQVLGALLAREGVQVVHGRFSETAAQARAQPQAVLVDADAPNDVLSSCVREVRTAAPGTRIVALLPASAASSPIVALADAVAPANADVPTLVALLAGEALPTPAPSTPPRPDPAPTSAEADLVARLTSRERDVLRLLIGGRSGDAIALEMQISVNTVRTHIQNILGKLNARNRLEAATIGLRAGLRPVTAAVDESLAS